MKAGSRFLNAVSAVALSAGIVASGAGVLTLASASVAEAAVIQKVDVRGASRTGADAVRDNITIKPGVSFTNSDIDDSVKQLYATGYFSNVHINISGGTLVVSVSENQIVNAVVFNGNRKIKDDKLQGVVKTHAAGPYDQAMIDDDVKTIKEAYGVIGRNEVTVTTQVVPVAQGRVNIAFVVNEGDRTKIDKINFTGNQAYGDGRLASVIATKKTNFLSFLTRKDVYSADKQHSDEDTLRQFYYNHGYADFRIVSSDATLDEQTNAYTMNFAVEEGPRYNYGDVSVVSTVDGVNADELKGLIVTKAGDTYDAKDIQKSIEAISKRVAAAGYPFARVTPRGTRNFSNNTIAVEYLVDQGERAYVERIEIRGNTRTRDYVIRREFDLNEGDAFNQEMITRAKRRLDALGYFTSVNITTAPGSAADRVVIVVNVVDQSTGSFGIGAGYSVGNNGGILLEASVEEKNFLGRGQYIRIAAGAGTEGSRTYNISFTEPYFLGYRLAAGFDIFENQTSSDDYYDYTEKGFSLRVTAPITEDLATTLRYNYKRLDYRGTDDWEDNLSNTYQNLITGGPWVQSTVSQTFTYNTLDDQNLPREGIIAKLTHEFAGLGGDSNFYKISGKARFVKTLSDEQDIIGSLTLGAGYEIATDGGKLNVFDQFMLGGREIRGFENTGIGPRTRSGDDDPLGGTRYFTASAEATMPMPGVPQDIGLRAAVFADAGSLSGNKADTFGDSISSDSAIRASVGLGVIWASPFGVLRVDYAQPVMKQSYDKVQQFRFGIANQF
ncbi:MAG: outer membrane protein assembly factor BamA [Rhizobium sp.]